MTKHIFDQWPAAPAGLPRDLQLEFVAHAGNGKVGSRLVSEMERVRVWLLHLKPGERIGFHTHVLDYFWTAVTPGLARSHYGDGEAREVSYAAGDTQHHRYAAGAFMIHDLENIGDTELVFATVEFLDGANAPLALPAKVTAAKTAA